MFEPSFQERATTYFRCRRADLSVRPNITIPQLAVFSLRGEQLAMRGLMMGSFDDLPDFLDRVQSRS